VDVEKRLGRRPETVARRAAAVLDAQGDEDEPVTRVRNQVADFASNRASYRPENAESVADDDEP
jgi:hypothetical protein